MSWSMWPSGTRYLRWWNINFLHPDLHLNKQTNKLLIPCVIIYTDQFLSRIFVQNHNISCVFAFLVGVKSYSGIEKISLLYYTFYLKLSWFFFIWVHHNSWFHVSVWQRINLLWRGLHEKTILVLGIFSTHVHSDNLFKN